MKLLKSLIVEDSEEDAEMLLRHLSGGGYEVEARIVRNSADLMIALDSFDWDIIFSEISMSNFTVSDVSLALKERGLDVPIIIISRNTGADSASEATILGVHDYLTKDNLERLPLVINRELENAASRRARMQAEESLRLSEQRLAEIQQIVYGSWDYDAQNNVNFRADEIYRVFNSPKTSLENKPEPVSGVADSSKRAAIQSAIRESEQRYLFLFKNNPLPMWIFDTETLEFLSVNQAAVQHYGYSQEEFLSMTLKEIRPSEDIPALLESTKKHFANIDNAGIFRHRKKDGTIIFVEIVSVQSKFNGKNAELVLANDVTDRKRAEEAMRQAETNYRNLVESSPGIVYRREPHPPYSTSYISPNVEKYGYSSDKWYAASRMWLDIIYKEDYERVLREFEFAVAQGLETELEYRIVARDGSIYWWQDKGRFVTDQSGNRIGWQGIILDITATKELKEQLRQSQKLESVGLLAGGIAHDFNNMLTAINGYSDLTLRKLKDGDPLRHYIEEIKRAGERSALLTHQLLAFSRQQVLKTLVLDLNNVITDTIKMLRRVIGEDIQLTTTLSPKAGRVRIDPGQFSQIIMNLAVNARDAMPRGGFLTIETANVFLDPAYTAQHVGFLPGAYVMLTVSDTGSGMSDEVKQHIFEPFFTTKEVGKGTGLGLATVYGIVKQSSGNIEVKSEVGVGTTFEIYLPRVMESADAAQIKETAFTNSAGTETILLVEDEELVRNLTRRFLEECGYAVVEASSGVEALSICERDCQVDLLMTDVVMPHMSGRELAEILTARFSHLKVLFTSGYTDDSVVRHGIIETNGNFIQKPFTLQTLAEKVRQILDNPYTS